MPDTIQDVIMARIDRLEDASKKTLQLASVIGREFTRRLLERIADIRGRAEEFLRELKAIELIYEKRLFPELAYMFKHALTHDVAYNSLLVQRRKELHRTIGLAIEELYADRLAEQYEVLAYHFARARNGRRRSTTSARPPTRRPRRSPPGRPSRSTTRRSRPRARLGDAVDPRTADRDPRGPGANLFGFVCDFRRAQEEGEDWLASRAGRGRGGRGARPR